MPGGVDPSGTSVLSKLLKRNAYRILRDRIRARIGSVLPKYITIFLRNFSKVRQVNFCRKFQYLRIAKRIVRLSPLQLVEKQVSEVRFTKEGTWLRISMMLPKESMI